MVSIKRERKLAPDIGVGNRSLKEGIMPATFAHSMLCQNSIGLLTKDPRVKGSQGILALAGFVAENNHFAITGAAGPDYPYLNDLLTTGVLHVGHTWADRMHYENTDIFIQEAVKKLIAMDQTTAKFKYCLAWTLGFISHIIADVYLHPVVNSIVGGTYHFTSSEHAYCEMVQDLYIFHHKTGIEIVDANPSDGTFAYLTILDMSSDLNDKDKLHPLITEFWRETLIAAHPGGATYFKDIDPDTWHQKYKSRVDFAVNPWPVARHIMRAADRAYGRYSKLEDGDRKRFIEEITLPNGTKGTYPEQFEKTVDSILAVWVDVLHSISEKNLQKTQDAIKDWNLDTGVDERKIHFWLT